MNNLTIVTDTRPGRLEDDSKLLEFPVNKRDGASYPLNWRLIDSSEEWASTTFYMCKLLILIDNWQNPKTMVIKHFEVSEAYEIGDFITPKSGILLFGSSTPWSEVREKAFINNSPEERSALYMKYTQEYYESLGRVMESKQIEFDQYPLHVIDFPLPDGRGVFNCVVKDGEINFWSKNDLAHSIAHYNIRDLIKQL